MSKDSLETIVRPFETRDIAPPRPYVPSNAAATTDNFGRVNILTNGEPKHSSTTDTTSESFYSDTKHKEKRPGH